MAVRLIVAAEIEAVQTELRAAAYGGASLTLPNNDKVRDLVRTLRQGRDQVTHAQTDGCRWNLRDAITLHCQTLRLTPKETNEIIAAIMEDPDGAFSYFPLPVLPAPEPE
jgi:peptide subunit release factor 1 (eRF1)